MNKKSVFVVGLFGAVLGCATYQASQAIVANAQPASGQYRECVAQVVDWARNAGTVGRNATAIAPGWTVVGAGGGPNDGTVVMLCR